MRGSVTVTLNSKDYHSDNNKTDQSSHASHVAPSHFSTPTLLFWGLSRNERGLGCYRNGHHQCRQDLIQIPIRVGESCQRTWEDYLAMEISMRGGQG